MTPERRSQLIKGWALEAGFDLAGVAVLERSPNAAAVRSWLERGDHAGMAYLERRFEERIDPRRLFPGARSALCVAVQYHPLGAAGEPDGDLWPRVARYARGDDYHLFMERRLRELGERIEAAFPGSRGRAWVDTGPILERELAARAGLGAIGKNTLLLHPERGSWLLLGELVLTLELAPDSPFDDLCGSCTACLDACPTGALPEPYRLDSRRCISYWTIEHRGTVPASAADALEGWVFGCDVCQEVCPVNEAPEVGSEAALRLPPARRRLDLAGLLGLSRDDYVETFRRSPMKRAKLEGLQRNAAIAVGRSGADSAVRPLLAALANESEVVREAAARALAGRGEPEAVEALTNALRRDPAEAVRSAAGAALETSSGRRSP